MTLAIGTRLGAYEITGALGAGGMGEVYRATDTNLKRTVAVKVLPQAVANDVDRLARFQREAEILAALNHPNIAAIYGLERTQAMTALVMELVEGPTLADLIATDGVGDVLAIARQIAEALEAAHEQGIVHRDLKPANIKVRADGTVKVLDFGLAKASAPDDSGPGSNQTTMTSPAMTQMGMILGTAAYMAPEQAKGRRVDRRADVWAFGAVLYEMVTRTRAFPGDEVTEVLASVLAREPDWTRLPTDAPALVGVIRRCLERDPKQRFGDMQSVRLALSGAFSTVFSPAGSAMIGPGSSRRWSRSPRLAWAVAGAATVAALVLGLAYLNRPTPSEPDEPDVVRTMIPPPDGAAFDFDVTVGAAVISPNGRLVAFSARSSEGRIQLWVQPLDAMAARPVAGTDGASFPFWSPDSQSLGYYSAARGRIERIDLSGGAPVVIAHASYVRAAHWSPGGTVLYDTSDAGGQLMEVSIGGGAAKSLVMGEYPRAPHMLPDGRHFLYLNRTKNEIRVAARDGSSDVAVTTATSQAVYANGRLLFMREQTLLAQPFDLSTRTLRGTPVAVASGVQTLLGDPVGLFSASDSGALLYLDGAALSATTLAWFDRGGTRAAIVADMGSARGILLSPDERSVMVGVIDAERRLDLWRVDLATAARARVTFATPTSRVTSFMVWSPNGRDIAYGIDRDGVGAIARRSAAGGSEEILFTTPPDQGRLATPRVTAWTTDGSTMVYSGSSVGGVWTLALTAKPEERTATQYVKDLENAQNVQLSPNQRWVVFQAAPDSGTVSGIFVEAFPGGGRRQQVAARGTIPSWSTDGTSLYYADDNILSVVDVTDADGALRFGPPRAIMPIIVGRGYSYDVAKDGRILALVTSEARAVRPLTLVQNWPKALSGR